MAYDLKQSIKKMFDEFWSKGNLGVIDELCDPSYEEYDPVLGTLNKETLKQSCSMYRAAFPDLRFEVNDVFVEGDKVCTRWTAAGTQKAPFMGVKASGKRPVCTGITVTEFRGGRALKSWVEWDSLHLYQELGIVPPLKDTTAERPQPELRS